MNTNASVGEEVGKEIDKQQLRYSEFLVSFAAGMLALITSAVLVASLKPTGFDLGALMVMLFTLASSILFGLFVLYSYVRTLQLNPHFLAYARNRSWWPENDLTRHLEMKKWISTCLAGQTVFFLIGVIALFAFVVSSII